MRRLIITIYKKLGCEKSQQLIFLETNNFATLMQEAVQVEIVNGSKESRLWSEPASIDARYDEEEESR